MPIPVGPFMTATFMGSVISGVVSSGSLLPPPHPVMNTMERIRRREMIEISVLDLILLNSLSCILFVFFEPNSHIIHPKTQVKHKNIQVLNFVHKIRGFWGFIALKTEAKYALINWLNFVKSQ